MLERLWRKGNLGDWKVNWYAHFGKQYGGFLKKKKKLKIELPYDPAILLPGI